jgi:hypothetical protein
MVDVPNVIKRSVGGQIWVGHRLAYHDIITSEGNGLALLM